jgi:hypothetical protein
MGKPDLSRRDFERLAFAALGGLAAGCQGTTSTPTTSTPTNAEPVTADSTTAVAEAKSLLLEEPHVCRGLNTCKGFGSDSCAGLSQCASEKAKHHCGGGNDCKGQGGCGANPGENSCKGQGGCSVPLMDSIWDKTRKRFEELMAKEGKKVGPAPAKKDG